MTVKILKLPQIIEKTGLSRASIYAFINQNTFPRQIKLGERSVGWLSSEIELWIESRLLQRDGSK